jgi:hypothetical protein
MDQNTPDHLLDLQVDHESGAYFKEAAKWGNFIAIIYFICIGLFLLVLLFASAALLGTGDANLRYGMENEFKAVELSPVATALRVVSVIAVFGLFVYGGLMLYRFASRCREGVDRQDQLTFNMGLQALRNYFICTGIVAILGFINDIITLTGI